MEIDPRANATSRWQKRGFRTEDGQTADLNGQAVDGTLYNNSRDMIREMKGALETRPIRVNTPEHIQSHLLICFMALTMMRVIQHKIWWQSRVQAFLSRPAQDAPAAFPPCDSQIPRIML